MKSRTRAIDAVAEEYVYQGLKIADIQDFTYAVLQRLNVNSGTDVPVDANPGRSVNLHG